MALSFILAAALASAGTAGRASADESLEAADARVRFSLSSAFRDAINGLSSLLQRRQVLFDFGDGQGPVPARTHGNGGGWVADTARVSPQAFVEPEAVVFGTAQVSGFAQIRDHARVGGGTRIHGGVYVYEDAEVGGEAEVSGSVHIHGKAKVYDKAQILSDCGRAHWSAGGYGTPSIDGHAEIYENAVVCGNARVTGSAKSPTKIHGTARVGGNAYVAYGELTRGVTLGGAYP